MEKTKNAVKYMIDVWDEVTGRTWRDRPDHVEQKFLEAEKELSNMPIIFSEAELKGDARIDNTLDQKGYGVIAWMELPKRADWKEVVL